MIGRLYDRPSLFYVFRLTRQVKKLRLENVTALLNVFN